MNTEDLRNLLQKSSNKFKIFTDTEILRQCNISYKDFYNLIYEFLSDDEKLNLLEYQPFKANISLKMGIINSISSEDVLKQILENENILQDIHRNEIAEIIKKVSDEQKEYLLNKKDFLKNYKLDSYEICKIIQSLNNETKFRVLSNKTLMNDTFKLKDYNVAKLIIELKSDSEKKTLIDIYEFSSYLKGDIIKTCGDLTKKNILLEDTNFNKYDMIKMLESFETDSLIDFIKNDRDKIRFEIQPYEIIMMQDIEKQIEFFKNMDKANLTENEKKQILATLKPETKQKIDTSNLSNELKSAFDMEIDENRKYILVNFEKNLEDYRGLDSLIQINPSELNDEQKEKFLELCDICPNIQVNSCLYKKESVYFKSTAEEYKIAEQWIETVLHSLKPEYTNAQKLAVIDNAIGKRISYSPDFETEIFSQTDCRALYKIISSGYGVCNGIARVEQYILEKVGIESEIISSGKHAFLKLKNIEFSLDNGENITGTTIIDPTWNLAAHRFNGRPNNFCISYAEARKQDIDVNGIDHECHKNDEKLQDATFNLDDASLRKLFKSVNLVDKDGKFFIKDLINKSEALHQSYRNNPTKNIEKQLSLLSEINPDFATCQNSTMTIIGDILLNNEALEFDKCVVDRVYDKSDKNKRPILYVYINSDKFGEKFYYADKEKGSFIQLSQNEFIEEFECYKKDLEKSNGIRPWESKEQIEPNTNLEKSSGNIIAQEGEER